MNDNEKAEARVPVNAMPAIVIGMIIALAGLGGFGAWAATAQISSAVIASGTLKVLTSRKKVQVAEAGIVRELLVKNGDRVKAGQVLMRLNDTRARAALNVAQSNYDLSRAAVSRLRAERDGKNQPIMPAEFAGRMNEQALREIVDGQIQIFGARKREIDGQISMMAERVGQLEEEIVGLEAQAKAKARQIDIIGDELKDLKSLLKRGLTPRARVLALEREAARLIGEKGEHEAGIARARRLISESRLEALQVRKSFDKAVRDELGQKETEMYTIADRVAAARHTFEQMEVRATENGIVVGLDVHTIGGVVQAGATVLEIVPVKDNLVIEAQIKTIDVDNVAISQSAEIAFSAFPQDRVPKLTGRVVYLSADALADPEQKTLYYLAHVAIPEAELARVQSVTLVPGMPADVFIQSAARTPLSYLVQPLQQSLSKAWREP